MTNRMIVPPGATKPKFEIHDRVRIVQTGIRDEYAVQTGEISGMNYWTAGWVYKIRLDTPVYMSPFCLMTERELVAETEVAS